MKPKFVILFLGICAISKAQINGVILNAETSERVLYVNIYLDDEHWTSADINGTFSMDAKPGARLILSAVGFESTTVDGQANMEIALRPTTYALPGVEVSNPKSKIEQAIGGYARKDIDIYYGTGTTPQMLARYFAPDGSSAKTPYAKKLVVATKSRVKNAKFILHFLASNKGKPGEELASEKIIGIAKKGEHDTEINLSPYRIKLPQDGFFIAFEWLIIPENRSEVVYQNRTGKPIVEVQYSPVFATTRTEINTSWAFRENYSWAPFQKVSNERILKYYDDFKKSTGKDAPPFDNRFNEFAMKLILTD